MCVGILCFPAGILADLAQEHSTEFGCDTCHTPHGAMAVADAPLWNSDLGTTGEAFTVYTSPTLDASPTQPDGASLLCLTCHDGVTHTTGTGALDGAGANNTLDLGLIGTDLTDMHPISFNYADGGAGLVAEGSVTAGLLFGGKVQCASCHDVHTTAVAGDHALRVATPALCDECHTK
jgi:predicted CXXCH cytochrome family protein